MQGYLYNFYDKHFRKFSLTLTCCSKKEFSPNSCVIHPMIWLHKNVIVHLHCVCKICITTSLISPCWLLHLLWLSVCTCTSTCVYYVCRPVWQVVLQQEPEVMENMQLVYPGSLNSENYRDSVCGRSEWRVCVKQLRKKKTESEEEKEKSAERIGKENHLCFTCAHMQQPAVCPSEANVCSSRL